MQRKSGLQQVISTNDLSFFDIYVPDKIHREAQA